MRFFFFLVILMVVAPLWAEEPASAPSAPPTESSAPPAEGAASAPPVGEADLAPAAAEYSATFKQGDLPFKKRASVRIVRTGDNLALTPKGESSWTVPVIKLRGVVEAPKGVWLYWFDETGNTLAAYFEASKDKSLLVSEINSAIQAAQKDPNEEYKERFEAYKNQALKEAR